MNRTDEHDPRPKVDVFWVFGDCDDVALVFMQRIGAQCRVVRMYQAKGEPVDHYLDVIRARGYNYGTHHGLQEATPRVQRYIKTQCPLPDTYPAIKGYARRSLVSWFIYVLQRLRPTPKPPSDLAAWNAAVDAKNTLKRKNKGRTK